MPRLFLKIYLTILASLALLVVLVAAFWHFSSDEDMHHPAVGLVVQLAAAALPPVDAPALEQQRALDELSHHLRADLALYGLRNELVAAAGYPLPAPPAGSVSGDWIGDRHGPAFAFDLPDGRRLVARAPHNSHEPWGLFGFHLLIAAIVVGLA